jgi:hypothetical protein
MIARYLVLALLVTACSSEPEVSRCDVALAKLEENRSMMATVEPLATQPSEFRRDAETILAQGKKLAEMTCQLEREQRSRVASAPDPIGNAMSDLSAAAARLDRAR